MSKLIIISGKAQSGKSWSVDFMRKHFPYHFIREIAFAIPLKEFAIDVMGLTRDTCYGTDEQKNMITHIKWANLPLSKEEVDSITKRHPEYLTGREFMEVFGTRICRRMFPDCWVKASMKFMEDYKGVSLAPNGVINVVSDARFPNEIDYFYNNVPDCHIIRLLRNPLNRDTETDLDNYNFNRDRMHIIDNTNMTIEEKNGQLAKILDKILA